MMGYPCYFPGCKQRATKWASNPLPFGEYEPDQRAYPYCANHYAEHDCPGHVASADDGKICARCGIHIDSLRPD